MTRHCLLFASPVTLTMPGHGRIRRPHGRASSGSLPSLVADRVAHSRLPVRRPARLHPLCRGPRGGRRRRPAGPLPDDRPPGVAEHDGAEIKTEGDSFYVVFQAVSAAVLCGLAIVAAAGRQTGPDGTTQPAIPVGVGIHAGETIETPDGYVGSAVNIAARICAIARPGEVLVSDTVRALTQTVLPVSFASRGRQKLKGVTDPVAVFAVVESADAWAAIGGPAGAAAGARRRSDSSSPASSSSGRSPGTSSDHRRACHLGRGRSGWTCRCTGKPPFVASRSGTPSSSRSTMSTPRAGSVAASSRSMSVMTAATTQVAQDPAPGSGTSRR